jgi:hypothetical protein
MCLTKMCKSQSMFHSPTREMASKRGSKFRGEQESYKEDV